MNITYEELSEKHIVATLKLFEILKNENAEVSFADVIDEDEIVDWIEFSNYYLYIAKANKDVIGVFRGIRGEDNKAHSILITISTDPKYRGKKIAHNLVNYSLADIKYKEKNILLARAYVFSDNKPSINTFLSCGFTVSGCVYKHHFNINTNKYVDDMIFHKIL